MEQSVQLQRPDRLTSKQLEAFVASYDKSNGITVKDFCKLHKIPKGSFYHARKRVQGKMATTKKKPQGFTAISRPLVNPPSSALFAEVRGIKLYQPVSVEFLKALAI